MTSVIIQLVHAPQAAVWARATDVEQSSTWLSGVDSAEVTERVGQPFGVGTRWRETRTVLGRRSTGEIAVTAVDEGHSCTMEAESGGVRIVSVFEFIPQGNSTLVRATLSPESSGLLGRLTAPPSMWLVSRQMKQDLADLAAAAEV